MDTNHSQKQVDAMPGDYNFEPETHFQTVHKADAERLHRIYNEVMLYDYCPHCGQRTKQTAQPPALREALKQVHALLCDHPYAMWADEYNVIFNRLATPTFIDITGAGHVEVRVKDDNSVLWVNVDGVCVLRICQIKDTIEFNR